MRWRMISSKSSAGNAKTLLLVSVSVVLESVLVRAAVAAAVTAAVPLVSIPIGGLRKVLDSVRRLASEPVVLDDTVAPRRSVDGVVTEIVEAGEAVIVEVAGGVLRCDHNI